jgi:hypothetical protein
MLAGGFGLGLAVASPVWWLTRPLWLGGLALLTVPFLAAFGRYERPNPDGRPAPPAWRPILAVVGVCVGLGFLAKVGIVDADGLNGIALSLPFAAAAAGGVGGARWWNRRQAL